MDAVIFDFDGVVIDSEPIHLRCFQQILAPEGVEMTAGAYYDKYIGYDDHDCFLIAARDHGVEFDEGQIRKMVRDKTRLVKEAMSEEIRPFDGVVELIGGLYEAGMPLAVCSAALREEIELSGAAVGVLDYFSVIVAAEDVPASKPDPAGYRLAVEQLGKLSSRPPAPEKTVAVEDSRAGIEAAKAVGLKVLAVTNSYAPEALAQADRIVHTLKGITVKDLEELT